MAMLITIELVPPEQTDIRVCLIVFLAIWVLKGVRAQFILLCFQLREICFFVCFTIPYELIVMFWFVRPTASYIFGPLYLAWKSWMAPSPTVLALGDFRIHIGFSNSSNIIANIKVLVNKHFNIASALYILYIDPVKVVNDRLGFILFSFSFIFLYFILSFFFLFLYLDIGQEDKIWYYMLQSQRCNSVVTHQSWSQSHKSYAHVMQ